MKSASKVHVFSSICQKCMKSASKVHLLTLVKFTNVSIFLLTLAKKIRKSTLVNPKIYVISLAPKFTSFGDSGYQQCCASAAFGAKNQNYFAASLCSKKQM